MNQHKEQEEALEGLVESCAKKAWRLAYSFLNNDADAHDAVQQALLIAVRKPSQVPQENPWPWFSKVLVYEIRNARRKRSRERSRSLALETYHEEAAVRRPEYDIPDPQHLASRAETFSKVSSELHALAEPEREALVLTYVSGLSYRDAAASAQIPFGTLVSRVHSGLRTLATRLRCEDDQCKSLLSVLPIALPTGGWEKAIQTWSSPSHLVGAQSGKLSSASLTESSTSIVKTFVLPALLLVGSAVFLLLLLNTEVAPSSGEVVVASQSPSMPQRSTSPGPETSTNGHSELASLGGSPSEYDVLPSIVPTDDQNLVRTFGSSEAVDVGSRVTCMAVAPSAKYIVSVSNDNALRLHDIQSREVILTYDRYKPTITCVAFTGSGEQVLIGDERGRILSWNMQPEYEAELVHHCEDESAIGSLEVSVDEETVLATTSSSAIIFNIENPAQVLFRHNTLSSIHAAIFQPSGSSIFLSTAASPAIESRDAFSGDVQATYKTNEGKTSYTSIDVSPCGQFLVALQGKKLVTWDIRTREVISERFFDYAYQTSPLVSFPNNSHVLLSGYNWIGKYDPVSHVMTEEYDGVYGIVTDLAYSYKESLVAALTDQGDITVWDDDTQQVVFRYPALSDEKHGRKITALACSPDGATLVSANSRNTMTVWSFQTGERRTVLEGHKDRVTAMHFTSDSSHMVSASWDGTLKLWDASTWEKLEVFNGHVDEVTCCVISPDDSTLFSAGRDGLIIVWELSSGRMIRAFEGNTGWVTSIACIDSGSGLLSVGQDGVIRSFDVKSGKLRASFESGESHSESSPQLSYVAHLSKSDRIVTADFDERSCLRLWNSEAEKVEHVYDAGIAFPVITLVQSKQLAVVSGGPFSILKIIGLRTGRVISEVHGQEGEFMSLALSSDDQFLVCGDNTGVIKCWELQHLISRS